MNRLTRHRSIAAAAAAPSVARRGAVALGAALAVAAAPALAADVGKGKEKHEQVCAACHGKDAASPIDPTYPKLAGQYPDYVLHSLKAYKSGERKNPIMGGIAKTLSTEDMKNVAAYYADLKSTLHVKMGSIRLEPETNR